LSFVTQLITPAIFLVFHRALGYGPVMDKIFRTFDSHQQADEASLDDVRNLSTTERLAIFLELMKPVYESSEGLQRIYRTRDLHGPPLPGDLRMGVQSLRRTANDR
jgi:hypothetical protein